MGVIAEMIPFAKEMLSHRPCRGWLRVYLLGSTLALLGAAGGLMETILLPLLERRQQEEEDTEPELLFMQTLLAEQKQPLRTRCCSGSW